MPVEARAPAAPSYSAVQLVSGVSRRAGPGGGRSAGRGLRAHPGGSRADATPPSAATPTVAGCGAASKPSPARPPPPREGSAGIPTAQPRPEAPPREGAEPGLAFRPEPPAPPPPGHAPGGHAPGLSGAGRARATQPASEPHLRVPLSVSAANRGGRALRGLGEHSMLLEAALGSTPAPHSTHSSLQPELSPDPRWPQVPTQALLAKDPCPPKTTRLLPEPRVPFFQRSYHFLNDIHLFSVFLPV